MQCRFAQLTEPLAEHFFLLLGVARRPMRGIDPPLTFVLPRHQGMAGYRVQAGRIIDDQLVLSDPYRQHPANEPPGGRIGVAFVADRSFHIDHAINDPVCVVGGAG
jgi:hypothetical protein